MNPSDAATKQDVQQLGAKIDNLTLVVNDLAKDTHGRIDDLSVVVNDLAKDTHGRIDNLSVVVNDLAKDTHGRIDDLARATNARIDNLSLVVNNLSLVVHDLTLGLKDLAKVVEDNHLTLAARLERAETTLLTEFRHFVRRQNIRLKAVELRLDDFEQDLLDRDQPPNPS